MSSETLILLHLQRCRQILAAILTYLQYKPGPSAIRNAKGLKLSYRTMKAYIRNLLSEGLLALLLNTSFEILQTYECLQNCWQIVFPLTRCSSENIKNISKIQTKSEYILSSGSDTLVNVKSSSTCLLFEAWEKKKVLN